MLCQNICLLKCLKSVIMYWKWEHWLTIHFAHCTALCLYLYVHLQSKHPWNKESQQLYPYSTYYLKKIMKILLLFLRSIKIWYRAKSKFGKVTFWKDLLYLSVSYKCVDNETKHYYIHNNRYMCAWLTATKEPVSVIGMSSSLEMIKTCILLWYVLIILALDK